MGGGAFGSVVVDPAVPSLAPAGDSVPGIVVPAPGGDVGTRAPGFDPAAGSLGVVGLGAGTLFWVVPGSAALPPVLWALAALTPRREANTAAIMTFNSLMFMFALRAFLVCPLVGNAPVLARFRNAEAGARTFGRVPRFRELGTQEQHMRQGRVTYADGFRILIGDDHSQAAVMVIAPGEREGSPGNSHDGADQWLYVHAGKGEAIVNGHTYELATGSLILIQRGDKHEIRNNGSEPLQTLNFYVPPAYTPDGEETQAGAARERR